MNKKDFQIVEFPDGGLCLECGNDQELVFGEGCTKGDPEIEKQREILEYIMSAIRSKSTEKC